jgi:transposase-like protein
MVQQAAQCRAPGEIGALLRREGWFSSQLTLWRKQYQAGARRALSQRRGPTTAQTGEMATVARLERENARLGAALAVLHEARFHDAAPAPVHATLLDEGTFVCSVRSMYRLLEAADEVRERRAQSGMDVGCHRTQRPGERRTRSAVRRARSVSSRRRRVDAGAARIGHTGAMAHSHGVRAPRHRRRPVDLAP